jgi:glycosyltransferase involved in cell wall biosynthesis
MRIAVVHSYYSNRMPSGENIIVDLQVGALRRAGHDVQVISRRQEDVEKSRIYPVVTALRVATNRGPRPVDEIDRFDPDIVHVHNLFPNFGRSWAARYSSRLVTTLHNYRPLCAAATLLRDGESCTLCPERHSASPALRYRCFKGTLAATLPVAVGMRFERDPLLAASARIIAITDDMRSRYAAIGFPEHKIVTVPNFVPAADSPGTHDGDEYGDFWLYVGRISEEKGILPLVREWPNGPRLKVVGTGPLEDDLRRMARPTVELLGQQPPVEVRALMAGARGLFFPSIWPEGLPTVYLEALAAGLPVVAGERSVVGQLVERDSTGIVISGSVADGIEKAGAEFPGLITHCRNVYEKFYTEAAWVRAVQGVYDDVLHAPTETSGGDAAGHP